MNNEQLIDELVCICKDYQNNIFDNQHVSEWVAQFQPKFHNRILSNLLNILKQTYFSKQDVEYYLLFCLNDPEIFNLGIINYGFLDIQKNGSSQKQMLDIFVSHSSKKLNIIHANELIDSGDYVYIDDCFYSGNRLYRDIQGWVEGIGRENINTLTVIYLGIHLRQHKYIFKEILPSLLPNIKIKLYYSRYLHDIKSSGIQYDSFLPSNHKTYTEEAKEYINNIVKKRSEKANTYYPIVRDINIDIIDSYFLKKIDRIVIETLFFEEGVKLQKSVSKSNFRPMGYDNKHTLGFGSFFVTYRNVPNNCPLVFWWGDKTQNHLGNWTPLFTRVVN